MTESDINVICERLDNLIKKQADDEERAEVWRGRFCKKLDDLKDQITALPCPSRIEQTNGIKTQLKALWIVTGGMVLAVLSEWVKIK